MVDRELAARLAAARVSFCLIGDRALALHGCVRRNGPVELLTVDEVVLRPLFWPDGRRPDVTLGAPGDPVAGRLRWAGPSGHELIVELVVGSGHAMVFALDTARFVDAIGCRVATPLGLILLAFERGGPGSRADVVELIRAQEAKLGKSWRPPVEEHLDHLPPAARQSWHLAALDLGSR